MKNIASIRLTNHYFRLVYLVWFLRCSAFLPNTWLFCCLLLKSSIHRHRFKWSVCITESLNRLRLSFNLWNPSPLIYYKIQLNPKYQAPVLVLINIWWVGWVCVCVCDLFCLSLLLEWLNLVWNYSPVVKLFFFLCFLASGNAHIFLLQKSEKNRNNSNKIHAKHKLVMNFVRIVGLWVYHIFPYKFLISFFSFI